MLLLSEYDRPSNEVAALAGRRLVVTSELNGGFRIDEGLVKDMTGGDSVSARFLYQESFTFRPTFKLWLYGNHRPTISGMDDGIWRRIRLIPFIVQIPEEKRDAALLVKLRAELPGILAWAVRGWQDFRQRGLDPPSGVACATAEYRTESDMLGQFMAECCYKAEDATVRGGNLYNRYKEWAEQNGACPAISNTRFGSALKERGFKNERDGRGKFWKGIGLLKVDPPM